MARKVDVLGKIKHTLSSQFRDVIESRGLSMAELGKLSGVDPTVIGRFMREERDITFATFDKLAAVLGLRLVEVGTTKPGKKGKRP